MNSGVFGQYDRLVVPGGVSTLQEANPERYGRLRLYVADADAVAELQDVPMTDTADHGAHQPRHRAGHVDPRAGRARGEDRRCRNPLADPVERLYAPGWSQTGMFWRAFVEHGLHAVPYR